MRSEGYCTWVCLSVCLSVHATTHPSIVCSSHKRYSIYFTGNDNQFNLAVCSEYVPLQGSERCQHSTHTNSRPFFTLRKTRMRIISTTRWKSPFFSLERKKTVRSCVSSGYHVSEQGLPTMLQYIMLATIIPMQKQWLHK